MFSKEGFRQNALAEHWNRVQVLNPLRIAEILGEEKVLKAIRTEVQRGCRFAVSVETISDVILNQVIRGDLSDQIKAAQTKERSKMAKKAAASAQGEGVKAK